MVVELEVVDEGFVVAVEVVPVGSVVVVVSPVGGTVYDGAVGVGVAAPVGTASVLAVTGLTWPLTSDQVSSFQEKRSGGKKLGGVIVASRGS